MDKCKSTYHFIVDQGSSVSNYDLTNSLWYLCPYIIWSCTHIGLGILLKVTSHEGVVQVSVSCSTNTQPELIMDSLSYHQVNN